MPTFNINNMNDFIPEYVDRTNTLIMELTMEYVKKKDLDFMDWLDSMGYEVRFEDDGTVSVYYSWLNERVSDRVMGEIWIVFNTSYPQLIDLIRRDNNG